MELLILLSQLTVLASQCMHPLVNRKCGSSKPDASLHTTAELLECADLCLSNHGGICHFMQWMPNTNDCFLFRNRPQRGTLNCVVAIREICFSMPGPDCYETNNNPLKNLTTIAVVKSESICRTLCRSHPTCRAYLYNTIQHDCRIQDTYVPWTADTRPGDIWMKRKEVCDEGDRCAVLQIGVGGKAIKKPSARTFYSCVKQVWENKDVFAARWNYDRFTCGVKYSTGAYAYDQSYCVFKNHNLEVVKSKECNEGPATKEVCFQKDYNMRMRGGYKLSIASEDDCVDMCRQLVSCTAVSWHKENACTLHHLEKPLRRGEGCTTYTQVPCADNRESQFSIKASHYTKQGKLSRKPISWKESIQTLECAFRCSLNNTCNSFNVSTKHPKCIESEKVTQPYIRKT